MDKSNYTIRLTGEGYELFLYAAPPLAVEFLQSNWRYGMTAAKAALLLAQHGYVKPVRVEDRSKGRVLGWQSSLRNIGELEWQGRQ